MKKYATINLVTSENIELLQYSRLRNTILKGLLASVACLLLLVAVEAAVLVYQYTGRMQSVPEELTTRFQEQQAVRSDITKKMDILINSEKERKRILDIIGVTIEQKPPDISFTSLQLVDTGSLQLECFSKEPESFHTFVERLNSQHTAFRNARVERIVAVEPAKVYKQSSIKTEFF